MKHWQKVKLGSLLTESKIVSVKPNSDKRLRVRLNALGVEKRPETSEKEGATKYYVRKSGQFIYGKQNLHKGAFGIVPKELEGFESSSDIPCFDVHSSCLPKWIYYYFKRGRFYLKLETLAKGVGSKRIQPSQIFDLDIYLPPINEQADIINKVQDLENRFKVISHESELQEKIIAQLQNSILQDAITGNITSNWRKKKGYLKDLDFTIEHIINEKNRLIDHENKKVDKVISAFPMDKFSFSVPKGWVFCRLDDIVEVVGGITKGKKLTGDLVLAPYLRVANVQRGYLDISEIKDLLVSTDDLNKYQLKLNDILVVEGGDRDKVGRSAIYRNEVTGCIYQNHIFRLRPFSKKIVNEEFINIVLNSMYGRTYFEKNAKQTTNLASINKTVVRSFPIALPDLKEQEEIVRIVTQAISFSNKISGEIKGFREKADNLLQTILNRLLGPENNSTPVKEISVQNSIQMRPVIYDSKTALMELVELLQQYGQLHAQDLWRMSVHYDSKNISDSIDKFYADLKKKIEDDRTIKEVENEKGYLELV